MNRIPNLCDEPRLDHAGHKGELRMQILQTVNDQSSRPAGRAIQTEKGGRRTSVSRGAARAPLPIRSLCGLVWREGTLRRGSRRRSRRHSAQCCVRHGPNPLLPSPRFELSRRRTGRPSTGQANFPARRVAGLPTALSRASEHLTERDERDENILPLEVGFQLVRKCEVVKARGDIGIEDSGIHDALREILAALGVYIGDKGLALLVGLEARLMVRLVTLGIEGPDTLAANLG